MTRLSCCRLRQTSLNELPNNRVVNLPEESPGALISDLTPTSSRSAHDLEPIRNIFAFPLEDSDTSEHQRFSDQDFGPKRAMLFSARRKEGNRKLREIARILRDRLSRESEVLKRRSNKKSKSDASEEDTERRKELKRALHRRLEEELLRDRTSSEEGYDADAIPIRTPNGTLGRTDGSSHYDSRRLRPGVGRFESPSPSLGRGLHQRRHPSKHLGHRQASTTTKDRQPDHSDQVLGLQRTSYSGLAENKHFPVTPKNQRQITTPRQDNITEQRFERTDLKPQQIERENVSEVRNMRELHPSRSANFFGSGTHKDLNRAATANRRRSLQHIVRRPGSTDSASNTRDVGGCVQRPAKWQREPLRSLVPGAWIEDTQNHYDRKDCACTSREILRDAEIEQKETEFDMVDDNDMNQVIPAVATKTFSRRSVSFSLDPVHETQTAPDAVSKLLVPSKSLSQLDMHAQRQQATNDNGSPLLHGVKPRHERRNSSAGFTHLQVPDALPHCRRNVASSNYSSYNDSLASSRRSSLMKLQSLSERLDCIKNGPIGNGSTSAWSSALDIPRVPSSQFTTAEIDNARRRTLEAERPHASAQTVRAWSPSPPDGVVDMQTEPFYEDGTRPSRGFRHKRGDTLKPESSERRNSSNLNGSYEFYSSSRRQGYGYDSVSSVNENASSLWGKAFQKRACKDSSRSKSRLGSVSPARNRQSLDNRVQGSKTPLTRPRLQRGRAYSSSDFWREHLQPSYRIYLDQPNRVDASKPESPVVLKSSSPGPAASWSRFPSHTRAERSFSPAGKADNVTARDFALEFKTMEAPNGRKESKRFRFGKNRKSRTMTYGESVKSTLNRIYSIDLRRLNRGNRSSISVGGKLEYPELEILPHLSPAAKPLDERSQRDIAMVLKRLHSTSSQQCILQEPDLDKESIISAGTWSKMYEDCIYHPLDIDESLVTHDLSVLSRTHAVSESARELENDQLSPRSSADMRTSTLASQKFLQHDEAKAQERALQAADDAWGRSTPSPRSSR